jgi:hypothetical protein
MEEKREPMLAKLAVLHEAINQCYVCSRESIGLEKPQNVKRGDPGRIMVVGQGPRSSH